MDCGIDFRFLLINPSLLFALFTILLMCGFQERLFDISMPRWVATGTALSGSSCIVYGLCMCKLENPRRVNVHKSELAPDYSLLLLTALMHLMRTFIEESLPLALTCNLSHDAQKHVRFVIVP